MSASMWFEQLCSLAEKALFRRAPRLYRAAYSFYKRTQEHDKIRLFRGTLRAGMTVLDVGASIGVYTDLFSRLVGREGKVHAFEPAPLNFQALSSALGKQANVVLNHAAVGDRSGELRLHLSDKLNTDHRCFDSGDHRDTVTVQAVALDDYLPAGTRVDFVKMDIQGFELNALRGMQRILQENPGISLVLEYFPTGLEKAGTSGAALCDFLVARGFALWDIAGDGSLRQLQGAPALNSAGYTDIFGRRAA